MTSQSLALYSDLLLDLQPYVSGRSYDLMCDGQINFYPGCTVREAACQLLASSILKKLQDETVPSADNVALTKFLSANDRCRDWSLVISDLRDELLVSYFRVVLDEFFFSGPRSHITDDLVQVLDASDLVGPGVSVGGRGTDFYTKLFSSPLTTTSEALYRTYRRHLAQTQADWTNAEVLREASFGTHRVVAGNRLTFVPKTRDVSRSICIEPSLNMMFQKGLGNLLERRLRQYFGIDLAVQQVKNRELALLGSVDGSLSTIDLSSASDTISLKMIEEFLPRHVLSLIRLFRSPTSEVSLTGERMQLYMVSTMGNGFTFPLQTVLFAAVVAAAMRVVEMPLVAPRGAHLGNFGVNGDDIICPQRVYGLVVRLLNILGFEVNQQKSFNEGPFRESCGGDFFLGHQVRGVYLKTLKTPQSRFVAINSLNEWSARHNVKLPRTVGGLLQSVRFIPVPLWEDPSAGIRCPWSMVTGLRRDRHTRSVLYERYVFEPTRLRIMDCDIEVPVKEKERIFNPSGLLLAFLRGNVRGHTREGMTGVITIRHDRGYYRRKVGIAPNWEHSNTSGRGSLDTRRLESAMWANMSKYWPA